MLKCLKSLSDWEPEYAKEVEQGALTALAEAAGVDIVTYNLAKTRVLLDGHYGPISDADWEEQDGRHMPMREARRILKRAAGASIGDVEFCNPEFECYDDGEGNQMPNCEIPGDAIKRELFSFYREIYGGMP